MGTLPAEFIPQVGKIYTPESLSAMSGEALLRRPLNDPAFSDAAVGSTRYDWRAHYTLRIRDRAIRAQVEAAFDFFASTAEGRHTLRQAVAMHQVRLQNNDIASYLSQYGRTGESRGLRADPQGKIVIDDVGSVDNANYAGPWGILQFNYRNIITSEYLGTDGRYHPARLAHVLYHELCHAKDPLYSQANFPAILAAQSVRDARGNPIENALLETPAIYDANPFLEAHGIGPGRDLQDNSREPLASSAITGCLDTDEITRPSCILPIHKAATVKL